MCLQTRHISDLNMSTHSNKNIFLPLHVERHRKSTNYPQFPILASCCMLNKNKNISSYQFIRSVHGHSYLRPAM